MKMLVHRTLVSTAAPFTLNGVTEHIRVDDASENDAITDIAWTAAAEIEQFAQLALLTQTLRVTIFDPVRCEPYLFLPLGPVDDNDTPTVTLDGDGFTDFEFSGGLRPAIRWRESYFCLMPVRMRVEYTAGFGATVADIPADIAQAIMDQAALHYDGRSPMDAKSLATSPHMARIGARYRGVQL